MDDRLFARIGSISAGVVGALSLLYAIAYLGITPADQRGSDVDKFFRSYLAHPTGLRLAAFCLFVSGLVSGVAVIALIGRITRGRPANQALAWSAIVAVIAGLATSAHGLGDLVGVDKLAHRYATGDAATKAAVAVVHVTPSAVDPRGLATFAAAGLVALAIGVALRPERPRLGLLGMALGFDMALLFVANAVGINALVLLTGALASVVLGPVWWFALARLLWATDAAARAPISVSGAAGI
ncbi:MAG: hypothetical protein QOK39_2782 [Acidimicrobiaceae bacterium]|jgi:membrane-associated PAP2 superfamily phosphatase|nr:hypothetical protein [Acidimicrobiaceae bacterium]